MTAEKILEMIKEQLKTDRKSYLKTYIMNDKEVLEKIKEQLEADRKNYLKSEGNFFDVVLYADRLLLAIKMMEGHKDE